MPIELCA
jgi:Transposase DDE domain group 1